MLFMIILKFETRVAYNQIKVSHRIGNRTIRSFIEMRMKSQKALKKNQVTIEKIKITKNKENT